MPNTSRSRFPTRRRDLRATRQSASGSPATARPGPPRHAARRRGRLLRVAATVTTGLLMFAGAGTATAWYELQSNITTPSISTYLPTDRPTTEDEPPIDALSEGDVNILVMGSDSREGANASFGDVDGMRSDTTLLVHISADRSRVDVVSIPRDLIVEIPSCALPGGSFSRAQPLGYDEHSGVRFNSAFSTGALGGDLGAAAACTIATVETMTGLFIDDFVIVDFVGFQDMVNAIGGVELCFEEAIEDDDANLSLEAGCQVLNGEQALGLARARKSLGDGSDISRMGRQQELLQAMVASITSRDVATNPVTLLNFLDAATSSLTTSERLADLPTLVGLGYSLRDLQLADVTFTTMPFNYSGNVVVQNQDGEALWESLRADLPMVLPDAAADEVDDGVSIAPPAPETTDQADPAVDPTDPVSTSSTDQ
ncbi:MAG: LCP family protein [Beutenbergiaceae bacterium]